MIMKNAKAKLIPFVYVLILLFASSCAYRFGSPERRIPGGYQLIAIPVFKNKTHEVSIESFFTQAMIMEVEKSSLAKVTSKEESQAIMQGEITNITYEMGTEITNSVDDFKDLAPGTALAKEYRIVITADIRLVRSSDMAVLWEGSFSGEGRYSAPVITKSVLNTANPLYNHSARVQNIQVIAQNMMAEAYERLTENF
jgi:hypothetical protein